MRSKLLFHITPMSGSSPQSELNQAMYLLWEDFTLFWFTIAYCIVVSIWECPSNFCTCSIGMPLSIALVAIVLRNLCGCILTKFNEFPSSRRRISTPLIFNLSYGAKSDTNNAGLWSTLLWIYFCRCSFVFASKYTLRSLSPFPNTMPVSYTHLTLPTNREV